MIVDLHVHTCLGSDDSVITIEQIITQAKEKRLDTICITEHGNVKSQIPEQLLDQRDLFVFAGMEASTELGDVLIFGMDSYPRQIWRAADIWRLVMEAGGVMIAAHPFRYGLAQNAVLTWSGQFTVEHACRQRLLRLVDALEVANGWATKEEVTFTRKVARMIGMRGTGGSDAHYPEQIGCCITVFDRFISTEAELIEELKNGRFRPEDRRSSKQKGPTAWPM